VFTHRGKRYRFIVEAPFSWAFVGLPTRCFVPVSGGWLSEEKCVLFSDGGSITNGNFRARGRFNMVHSAPTTATTNCHNRNKKPPADRQSCQQAVLFCLVLNVIDELFSATGSCDIPLL